jgi:hypothetical protein
MGILLAADGEGASRPRGEDLVVVGPMARHGGRGLRSGGAEGREPAARPARRGKLGQRRDVGDDPGQQRVGEQSDQLSGRNVPSTEPFAEAGFEGSEVARERREAVGHVGPGLGPLGARRELTQHRGGEKRRLEAAAV